MPSHPLSNPDRAELSERAFRKYEWIFAEFLETYPQPYRLKAVAGRETTLVVRLREAANAVLANSHKFLAPLSFPLEDFRAAWAKVSVSIRGDEVIIAERSAFAEVVRAQVAKATETRNFVTISNPTLSELASFASVILRHGYSEPFLFTGEVPSFTPPLGVVFEQTPDGWMML